MTDKPPTLRACPFCGGEARSRPDDIGSGGQHVPPYHAGCSMCRIFFTDAEEEAAVALWNRRAALAAAEAPNDGMVLAREYEALIRALCESNNPVSVLADWTAHAGLPAPRAAAEAEEGWRPISEAPKDQSPVWVSDGNVSALCMYVCDGWSPCYIDEMGEACLAHDIVGALAGDINPTHVRLLPPPPAGSEPR